MFSWLPYRRVSIQTALTVEDAVSRLSSAIIRRRIRWGLFPTIDAETGRYEGVVTQKGFNINRVIGYRNSFLPVVEGKLIQTEHGALIEVSMMLHPVVLVIMILWCGASAFALLYRLILELMSGKLNADLIGLAAFLLSGYLLSVAPFNAGADAAEAFVRSLFSQVGSN